MTDPLLDAFIDRAARLLSVQAIAVFGSRGRGDYQAGSDYDIVVVSGDLKGLNPLRRRERLSEAWASLKAADIFGLTGDELLEMGSAIIWDMLEDGQPLLDTGVWKEAVARFRAKKAAGEITPVKGGWRVAERPGPT